MKLSNFIKSFLIKFSIFFLSLIILLSILEISLRVAGTLWQNKQIKYSSIKKDSNYKRTLFCFGDSYTVGGLGRRETAYPTLLSDEFLKGEIQVFNLGICESNSTQVLENINNNLNKKVPDVIVLLAGAANKYNFYGMKKINFYQKFRIYKMCHIMYLSLKNKFLKKNIYRSPVSGYFFSPDLDKIFSDSKKISNAAGTIYAIHGTISKNNNFIPRNYFLKRNKKIVQNLVNTLSDEEKKSVATEIAPIYLYLGKDDEFMHYYNFAKTNYGYTTTQSILTEILTNYYFYIQKRKQFLNFINEHNLKDITFNEYPLITRHYLSELFFCKDQTEKKERLAVIEKYIDKLISTDKDSLQTNKILFQYYKENGNFDKAINILNNKISKEIGNDIYKYYLDLAYYSVYYTHFDKAIYYFLEAFKIKPSIDMHCYYYFSKSFELQSKYDSNFIVDELTEILKQHSNLKNNYSFMSTLESFKNKIEFERKILDWLQFDMEQIIQICKSKNIKLFIQNYPFPYLSINEKLKSISQQHNVSFIDNYSIFCDLVKKDGYSTYFLDFDHCTEIGHKIIAQNVYKALIKEGFVDDK